MPESSSPCIPAADRMAVVLLRPKSPGNVGSVARAMKNMGFTRLVLAEPMEYDAPSHFRDEARRMAWNAIDVLDARREEPELAAALSPFTLVVGTTSRPVPPARVLSPRDVAAAICAHLDSSTGASAAILFGQEDIGLTREAQARCHLIGSIPASGMYPSLNLSHAVLLFLYELSLSLAVRPADPAPPGRLPPPPTTESMEAFYARLESTLEAIDFFQGTARGSMMRELRALFNRAILSPRELAIFEGIVHRIGLTRGR